MKHRMSATLVVCAVSAGVLTAGELRLKTRSIATNEAITPGQGSFAAGQIGRRVTGARQHWLIEIPERPQEILEELRRRGATVLAVVPENGYIVGAADDFDWRDLAVSYRDGIAPDDKVSPRVRERALWMAALEGEAEAAVSPEGAAGGQLVLVRFHADVEPWQAQGILDAEGASVMQHAALEDRDRLVEASAELIARLRLWDEIEYIFPAPEGMKSGEPYQVCGGVHAGAYEVSMLAAVYGEGWDGAGRGRADLTYSFGALMPGVDAGQVRGEARRAFDEWSRAVALSFRETTARQSARNIDILFATGDHGDPFPFAPGTRTLGHSFYPAPPNAEPIAGDIHVNSAFSWSVGGAWDIYSVLLHEMGHSLGIGHTDTPDSVMYPYYQAATTLKSEDIASIRQLYADAGAGAGPSLSVSILSPSEGARTTLESWNFSGSLSGAGATASVDYRNESAGAGGACLLNSTRTTWSCAAVRLVAGQNRIAVRAVSGSATATVYRLITREAAADPLLSITSPAGGRTSTTASGITILGNAQHASGVASVAWSALGQSGLATLSAPNASSTNWSLAAPVALGANEIRIRVTARSGQVATATAYIERTSVSATPPTNPTTDRTAPTMTVQSPIGTYIFTSAARMTFRGHATDNNGVTRISWRNSAGAQTGEATTVRTASGVQWSFDVNLQTGFNAIEIRAFDAAGNASGYTATVRRY